MAHTGLYINNIELTKTQRTEYFELCFKAELTGNNKPLLKFINNL